MIRCGENNMELNVNKTKFADDSTVIGLIMNTVESEYRDQVRRKQSGAQRKQNKICRRLYSDRAHYEHG